MEPGEATEEGPTFERTLRCSRVELGRQCFRDSVFFPPLQVTSGLFFPPNFRQSYFLERGTLGPSSVGHLKTNGGRTTDGRVWERGFPGGWKRGENWAIL